MWRIGKHYIDEGNPEKAKFWLNRAAQQGDGTPRDSLQQLSETDLKFVEETMGRHLKRAPSAGPCVSRRERISTQSDSSVVRQSVVSRSASVQANSAGEVRTRRTPVMFRRNREDNQHMEAVPRFVEPEEEKKENAAWMTTTNTTSRTPTTMKSKPLNKRTQPHQEGAPSELLGVLGSGVGAVIGAAVGTAIGVRVTPVLPYREDLCVGVAVGSGMFLGSSLGSQLAHFGWRSFIVITAGACIGVAVTSLRHMLKYNI